MNSATQPGDIVAIPQCTSGVAWTTQVTWSAPSGSILKGAGTSAIGGGDQTVILDQYDSSDPVLAITLPTHGSFRMTGITIKGGNCCSSSPGHTKYNGIVAIGGISRQFRFDHNHVNAQSYTTLLNNDGVYFTDWLRGVADHNIMDMSGTGNGFKVFYSKYAGADDNEGNLAWAEQTALGSEDYLFFEDNQFNSNSYLGFGNDCLGGGKYVARFNTFTNSSLQTHPTGGGADLRGCRAWEAYANLFQGTTGNGCRGSNTCDTAFFISSGTGAIWGNTVNAGYHHFLTLHSMRKGNTTYTQAATPNGWGYCGTSFNGTGSNWDGNTSASTGYPCLDQPGRGVGDLIQELLPSKINVTTGCDATQACAWPRQALEPIYEWLNTWDNSLSFGGDYWSIYEPSVLTSNQDYYLFTSSFTGASGVGSGLLSQRPSSCTPGVAYWATDQGSWNAGTNSFYTGNGQLYKCVVANTWQLFYVPATYPHPLVN